MLTTILMSLTVPVAAAAADPGSWFASDAPIQVWLSKSERLERGDRVRVYARAEMDGYLVVLHAEPSGRVRVLFPLDPGEDNYVRGGASYEMRGRGNRAGLQIYDASGSGTVFAAFSRDPFRFDEFTRGDHWDYTQLDAWRVADDAEGHLIQLVDRMATGRFDYDLVLYGIGDYVAYRRYPSRLSLYASYYYPYHGAFIGLSFGRHYYYRPYYRAVFYDPFFYPYHPFYYDACWYGPCYYRAHYLGWYYPRHRYYYAYYPTYWYYSPATRFATGAYTFKLTARPQVVDARPRAPLAAAVTRRLAAPETGGSAFGRRTVGVAGTAQQPANAGGRRVLTTGGNPAGGTPVTSPDGRRTVGGGVATPAQPADRTVNQGDRVRRELGPATRDRVDGPSEPRRIEQPRRDELRDRAVEPIRREVRVNPPLRREAPDRAVREAPSRERAEPQAREAPRERAAAPAREPPRRAEPAPAVRRAPRQTEPRAQPAPRLERRSEPAPRREAAPATRAAAPRTSPPRRSAAPPRSSPPPRVSAPAPRSGRSAAPAPRAAPRSAPSRSQGSGGRRRP